MNVVTNLSFAKFVHNLVIIFVIFSADEPGSGKFLKKLE